MDLFDKCVDFNKLLNIIKAQKQFFYLRQFDPAAKPIVTLHGKKVMMLGSNNYLGLANHPKVVAAVVKAIKEYGTGSCSSRILTGTTSLHSQLEAKIAEFKGTEDAVVFSTGFMTMMGTITALTGPGDFILSDEFNHASIVDGCRLSKAEKRIYKHNNMTSLEEELARCPQDANKLIVTDSVFSMRGTVANLPEIRKLADRYGAKIMIDDAHGTGVLGAHGRGTPEYFNMEGKIDVTCGTFSKTFSTIGGFTGAKAEVVTYLKLNSRPFIFTASPPPSVAATVLACLEVIEEEPELLKKLHKHSDFFKKGLKDMGFIIEETITPIIPIVINNDEKTFRMAGGLEEEGVIVNPIVAPAVPKDCSLIRVSLMASFETEELSEALGRFKAVGTRLGII